MNDKSIFSIYVNEDDITVLVKLRKYLLKTTGKKYNYSALFEYLIKCYYAEHKEVLDDLFI